MSNLTNSQQWIIVTFTATVFTLGITFFLEGSVQIFGYIVVGLLVAAFAILHNADNEKRKNSQ